MQSKPDERRKGMAQGTSRSQVILATLGVAMALLLAALDQTVVGVAMPRIVSDLHGIELYAWVTTAYLITSTALVPVAGKLGDMFGRKPFMLAGMVGFIAASALCGVSQNMIELVLFRGVQGIFGGVLFASTFAVMTDIFPPEQRARMSGVFGAIFGLSSVVGPSLGGFLTDGPGWRSVFYVNIPLGVVATILVATQLPRVRSQARLRDIDFAGTALLLAGLTPLLISLSMLRDHSWLSVQVLGLLGLAVVILVAFFITERRVEHPIVPFGLFPLTLVVVQAGLPHQLVGVATSQITFWRSLGGTIGTAVLGAVLTNHLSNQHTRLALAGTLHDLFLLAALVAVVSLVVSVFLREVPLTKESQATPDAIEVAA